MKTPKPLRTLKARTLTFRKAHRPIIVLGLRRGGSTMVSDAAADADGVWFSDEPYAVFPQRPDYEARRTMLPPAEHSHFFGLEGAALEKFATYTQTLLRAERRAMGTCRFTKWPLHADRVCLKVLNAPWMLDWFATETDALLVPLVRHPGAQALSILRQGWDYPVRAYAKRPEALGAYFSEAQIEEIQRRASGPRDWDLAVLDWIVTSAPLRRAPDRGLALHFYEDIARNPTGFADRVLIDGFGLKPARRVRQTFARPSGSSKSKMSEEATKEMIRSGQIEALLTRWRSKVDEDMLHRGQVLLDTFDVREYSFLK